RSLSLEARMYPTSIAKKLPGARFRLSEQSDMFTAQSLPGCVEPVKALRPDVGKHVIDDHQNPMRHGNACFLLAHPFHQPMVWPRQRGPPAVGGGPGCLDQNGPQLGTPLGRLA